MTVASEQVRVPPSATGPFRSLGDVQALLDRRVNYETDRRVSPDRVFTLDRMERCMKVLGRPDRAYRTVHVAGTKGKGSTSRLLAALLRRAGLRVGLYTSPHVEHLRERIGVDGVAISEAELVSAFNVLARLDERLFHELTVFELLTAAACWAFREARVDVAVIEVGIGGRLDATNVISPDVAVITTIGYDHMDVLGETLEEIAFEKAGIIKPGVRLVCGVTEEGPGQIIAERAAAMNVPVRRYQRDYDVTDFLRTGYRAVCSVRVGRSVWRHLVLSTPARFMATNAAHALAAFEALAEREVVNRLDEAHVRDAFGATSCPACCEVFPGRPTVVVDGAHNAMAAAALSDVVRTVFEGRDRVLVIGVPRDKDVETIIGRLAECGAARAVFTRYPGARAMPPDDLARVWLARTGTAGLMVEQPHEAFRRAVELARGQGVVVVTGSIHLAGIIRPLVRQREQQPA
jgi:dihydrofolate synthase/folylpolyglutamate synthase